MRTLALLCVLFTCVAATSATSAGPTEWPQFRLNSRNDARVLGGLEVMWRIKTGGPISASPTLHNGTLFIGNNVGQFFALNVNTGAIAWTKKFPSPLMAAPIVYGGSVFLGEGDSNSYRFHGTRRNVVGRGRNAIIALNAESGSQQWSLPLQGSGMPTAAIVAGVLVHHDGAGVLSGIDPSTGVVRFSHALGSSASMSAALPVGGDKFVTNGAATNTMWELHASDGSVVWQHAFDARFTGVGDCPSATDGKRVFCDYVAPINGAAGINVGKPGEMHAYALSLTDGASVWDATLESGLVPLNNEAAIPLVAHGAVYLGNSLAPWMHAVSALDGRTLWRTQVHGPVLGGVVRSDGVVYFGDLSGYLWAIDENDGRVLGDVNIHASFNVGSPVLYGRTLFIGTKQGEIIAEPLARILATHDP